MFLSIYLDVSCLVLSLYFRHYRVAPLDLKHLISNLVELLHVATSKQVGEVLYVFKFVELLSYG
jgi:hypothetical protein